MPSKLHEEILSKAIDVLAREGYKVIRLDSRAIPDAIAIDFENKKVIAVEADTSPSSIFLTRMKYEKDSQYDEGIIVTKTFPRSRSKPYYIYKLALELRSKGLSERKIAEEIFKREGVKVANSTIHYWISGRVVK